ncbi:MAG: SRPBCC family protein [Patescibacteria group bacterium]|nr:SRPBCC family protein [Patescibacteria group bacterium]
MQLKDSIIIAASTDRVWEYVRSPELWNLFDDKVQGCRLTSGQDGRIGAIYDINRRLGTRVTTMRSSISELQPCRTICTHEMMPDSDEPAAVITYQLDDLGSSTRVTALAEIRLPRMNVCLRALIWFVSRFGSPLGETALMRLKRIVEMG